MAQKNECKLQISIIRDWLNSKTYDPQYHGPGFKSVIKKIMNLAEKTYIDSNITKYNDFKNDSAFGNYTDVSKLNPEFVRKMIMLLDDINDGNLKEFSLILRDLYKLLAGKNSSKSRIENFDYLYNNLPGTRTKQPIYLATTKHSCTEVQKQVYQFAKKDNYHDPNFDINFQTVFGDDNTSMLLEPFIKYCNGYLNSEKCKHKAEILSLIKTHDMSMRLIIGANEKFIKDLRAKNQYAKNTRTLNLLF